jgi:hypothetical protein
MNLKELLKYEKTLIKLLKTCANKDETRKGILNQICHYEPLKMLVSTDGHRACFSFSMYDPTMANKSIDLENYRVSEAHFPRMENVFCESKLKKADAKSFFIHEHKIVKSKVGKKPNMVYFYNDGRIEIVLPDESPRMETSKEGFLFAINANYLSELAGKGYEVWCSNPLNPVYFKLNEECRDYMVIMPIKSYLNLEK